VFKVNIFDHQTRTLLFMSFNIFFMIHNQH